MSSIVTNFNSSDISSYHIRHALRHVPSQKERYKFYMGTFLIRANNSGLLCGDNPESANRYLQQADLYCEVANCINNIDTLKIKATQSLVGQVYEGSD